jgi:hypothetical protein
MKKTNAVLLALAVCGAAWMVYAAQDVVLDGQAEVRDPVRLEVWLEANASDAETRLAAVEAGDWSGGATLAVSNSANAGAALVTLQADKGDDAGDKTGLLTADGGGLAVQTDQASKGTLATQLTIGNTGIVTMKGGATLDNTASAAELNITETTVKVTGALTATGLGTFGGLTTGTGEATFDGKYGVVGGDASTGLMMQKAACTAGTNATETISFAVVFGAAPIVQCTYTEDPGDVRPIFVTSVTASNFVANITADKNYGYIAVGTRP